MNGKSILSCIIKMLFHREGAPPAESIPVTQIVEVHPGAGSVKHPHGNERCF